MLTMVLAKTGALDLDEDTSSSELLLNAHLLLKINSESKINSCKKWGKKY
jgi:hypothetical protein